MKQEVFDAVAERSGGYCENCGKYFGKGLHKHHAFNGSRRRRLEYEGTVFDLCYFCHEGNIGVHNNRWLDLRFKAKATRYLEEVLGWDKDTIIQKVGRYYYDPD
jgi:hypothetical protein